MSAIPRRRFVSAVGSVAAFAVAPRFTAPPAFLSAFTSSAAQDPAIAPAFKTALELARMIREKQVSSVELTQYFIDRIERLDTRLNAVVVRDFDRALMGAREADAALARGAPRGPLHGLPMTIKESYDIAGLPTTRGVPDLAETTASRDAAVVTRFKAAGAHFMGKTNVPRALSDIQSYNEIYGTTNNPWNTALVPGGSSGGSAAALAAGLTGLESGSDIGGSIRNPAHFCGVYGHKPTWGIVPQEGHTRPGQLTESDLSVPGPMARSADGLAQALELVAGASTLDAPGWRLELPEPRGRALSELRVAVWQTEAVAPPSRAIADRVQRIADLLTRLGATVSETARPGFSSRDHQETYQALMGAAMSQPAEQVDSGGMNHRRWLHYHNERTRIRLQWREFFRDWDILVCPIMVTTAFPHDHRPFNERTLRVDGVETPFFGQVFWAGLATLGLLPSTVFPTGLADDRLPIGLQAISAEYHDRTTIEFARLLAEEIGGFIPPPGYGD